MTDHNARQAGMTSILGPDEDGLPIERYSHRSFGMAPHPNGTYVRYSEVERRLAAHSADARNGEALTDALKRIKEMVCGDRVPRWDGQDATTWTRGKIADICDSALLDAPTPKPARIEARPSTRAPWQRIIESEVGSCWARDWEVRMLYEHPAPAPAAQAAPFRAALAALVDIHDDYLNNAPEDRCYVDTAFREQMNDSRALLNGATDQCFDCNATLRKGEVCSCSTPADAASKADKWGEE